eukprot:COSAG01_NODE_220_length_21453_cov_118.998361_13_plen_179_part_00
MTTTVSSRWSKKAATAPLLLHCCWLLQEWCCRSGAQARQLGTTARVYSIHIPTKHGSRARVASASAHLVQPVVPRQPCGVAHAGAVVEVVCLPRVLVHVVQLRVPRRAPSAGRGWRGRWTGWRARAGVIADVPGGHLVDLRRAWVVAGVIGARWVAPHHPLGDSRNVCAAVLESRTFS